MNRVASHNMVGLTDTGAHQEPLSGSTVMGSVTLHVQVSHNAMMCLQHFHFNPLETHICVSIILTRFTMGRVPGTGMHQRSVIHQGMNDTSGSHPPRDEFQIDSQCTFDLLKDWAWGGLSASEVQRRAMHAYNDQLHLLKKLGVNPDWCMQSMLRMSRLGNARGSSKIQRATYTGIL